MAGLGLEPVAAEWKAQTNSLSYGGTPIIGKSQFLSLKTLSHKNLLILKHLKMQPWCTPVVDVIKLFLEEIWKI